MTTIDPKETEQAFTTIEKWAKNWSPVQDRQTRERELLSAANHLRALQSRVTELEQDSARNAHAAKDFERAYNAAARRLSEIYGALEWAAKHVYYVKINAVQCLVDDEDSDAYRNHDCTGPGIADALIALAKETGR